MKVRQLIEMLKAFPPDYNVVVDGYEGGYDDPGKVLWTMKREKNGNAEWYIGRWDEARTGKHNTVVIPRDSRSPQK